MEEILKQLEQINIAVNNCEDEIIYARNNFNYIYEEIDNMKRKSIINLNEFKRRLREDGLYTKEIGDFIENYLKFYNN